MTSQPAIDWRSILLGFAGVCLAVTALSLIAPIRDRFLLAGLAGATCIVSAVLAALAKPQASQTH